ncbi:MAG: competence/damage-inducible protein A [Ignavibacteria bacterium]|nr:competence/damage-inducible protein A [Ignavibacteria bacterium]
MNIAILTIGDELCIGQIINTNAAWLAQSCTDIGAHVHRHITIGDSTTALLNELHVLSKEVDCIIMSGGLGPTHDDKTKETLVSYFNDTLILDEETLHNLKARARLRGLPLNQRNIDQAMLPSQCRILSNPRGSAPGMLFQKDVIYVSLPGVPSELKGIMNDHVLPLLRSEIEKESGNKPFFRTILTKGIPESALADLIGDPTAFLKDDDSLAFLPSYHGVRLRIGVLNAEPHTAQHRLDELQTLLIDKVGEYVFGYGNDTLLSVTTELLKQQQKTISVVESCTGGMLGSAFTQQSGSSSYFIGGFLTYSNELKMVLADVSEQSLTQFGAVSKEVAEEMAKGGRQRLQTDYCISITGIAGPEGGSEEKPIGTVWIALASEKQIIAKRFNFGNDRAINRERSVAQAIAMLYDDLIIKG